MGNLLSQIINQLFHLKSADFVIQGEPESLISKINEKQIDAIAFSQAPGLAPCLLVGMRFAKKLAMRLNIPIPTLKHLNSWYEVPIVLCISR